MSFVNTYQQAVIDLDYAEEFTELGSRYIYSLGYSEGLPVVKKSKTDGSIEWIRSLDTNYTGLRFVKLIQLNPASGTIYVSVARVENRFILFSFYPNGSQHWLREFTATDPDPRMDLVPDSTSTRFFLIFNAKSKGGVIEPKVHQYNFQGILGNQIRLQYSGKVIPPFMLYAGVTLPQGGLAIGGQVVTEAGLGILIELDSQLKVVGRRTVEKLPFHDVVLESPGKYIVSGYSLAEGGVSLFQLHGSEYFVFPNTVGMDSYLTMQENELFATIFNKTFGTVHRLEPNINQVWTKQIEENSVNVPLSVINYVAGSESLTWVSDDERLLGYTNRDLESCLTKNLDNPELAGVELIVKTPTVATYSTAFEPESFNVKFDPYESKEVDVCAGDPEPEPGVFELTEEADIQSGHLYLQAAGSTGADSTKGNHLRWMLRGALSEHLPKADYATTTANFNKPDDYVRIYRARYSKKPTMLTLAEVTPMVQSSQYQWIYPLFQEGVYLHFLNQTRYDQLLLSMNPAADPNAFLQAYGAHPLELEHKTKLSFAVTLGFGVTGSPSEVELELVSVDSNDVTADKVVSLRQRYTTSQLLGNRLLSENIRSVRFRPTNALIQSIQFEFYSDFITDAYRAGAWQYLGKHALTQDDSIAFNRLEPQSNSVNGSWLRFNDDAYVKVQNYIDRWNSAALDPEERIKDAVGKYISLSDSAANPTATELIYFNDPNATPIPGYEPDPDFDPSENQFELSNLMVLNMAALDYHVARMVGLGVLDLDNVVFSDEWVYLAEYFTVDDLGDGLGVRNVQHLYMSLPTELAAQRLPLAVDLKEPVPGVIFGLGTEAPAVLTDPDGYSPDGRTRFLSLFHDPLPEEEANSSFWQSSYQFVSADLTYPVHAGIEYKNQGSANWDKPELPHQADWFNIDSTVPAEQKNETRVIVIPEPDYPMFVHRERTSGWHDYSSYGINWFSRATDSTVVRSIETTIAPNNTLQPPTNINAFLIRNENPLLLTSANEQVELAGIATSDKTFIRLSFDYHHAQELIDYHKEINGDVLPGYSELPDAQELFAEDIEIFFRSEVPNQVTGKIISVSAGPNDLLSEVETDEYVLASQGINPNTNMPNQVLVPSVTPGTESNFIGGVLSVDGLNYIIQAIDNTGTYPKFTVFKVDASGNSVDINSTLPASELSAPPSDILFMAVENMLSPASWGTPNPNSFAVNIDHTTIHTESVIVSITDGTKETHVQKFRGIYRNALVEKVLEDHDGDEQDGIDPGDTPRIHLGLYKFTFNGYSLAQHSQAAGTPHRVEFHRGVVRLHTDGDPDGPRKVLNVLRTENIGTSNDLILYAVDPTFDGSDPNYDEVQIGTKSVNYYPGYKTYLKYDATYGLTEGDILPSGGEQVKYSIFGLRSHDVGNPFVSKISVPVPMYAQAIIEPQQPQLPGGGLYATRPDFYGKSTYTFTTKYNHEPYAVQFLRGSDIQILNALYTDDDGGNPSVMTVKKIQEQIFGNRKDVWFNDRWKNLIGFDYTYASNPSNNGQFEILPAAGGVQLPLPNNDGFIAAINAFIDDHNSFYGTSIANISSVTSLYQVVIPGTAQYAELQIVDFVKQVVYNCFVPLTEIPVLYEHIKGSAYEPIPKKQVIRDSNGNLLDPSDPDFDMAPMAKVVGPVTGNPDDETQFTDFTIDGAANATYFYAVREFGLQMKAGEQSPILGPISLVNSAAPRAPEVVKVTPILEDRNIGIDPAIQLEINAYAEHQRIRKINVYRATSGIDAQSIRTMTKVQEIDVATAGIQNDPTWAVRDDFSDLGYVPYGDPLFYVVTVSREVEYHDRNGTLVTEFAPSEPSKMVLTNIVEAYNPEAPKLRYYSTPVNGSGELQQVTIVWDQTVRNGKYHLFQLNSEGTWIEIQELMTNDATIIAPLAATSLASGTLLVDDAGTPVWHQFKVVSENFSGMISREDRVLTVHNLDDWDDIVNL